MWTSKIFQMKLHSRRVKYIVLKNKVLTKENFKNFLLQADDQTYLLLKVILLHYFVVCRYLFTWFLLLEYLVVVVEDLGNSFKICIPGTNSKKSRALAITEGNLLAANLVKIVRQYNIFSIFDRKRLIIIDFS